MTRYLHIGTDGSLAPMEEALPYDRVAQIVGFPIQSHLIAGGRAYLHAGELATANGAEPNHFAGLLARTFIAGTAIVVGPPDEHGEDGTIPVAIEQDIRLRHEQWRAR